MTYESPGLMSEGPVYTHPEVRSFAYLSYAEMINKKFGTQKKLTLSDIYYSVGVYKGLTREDSLTLVKGAVEHGYLVRERIKGQL